jgi:hypothetical protein
MKKQYLISIAFLAALVFVQASETSFLTVEWQKSYGDDATVMPNTLTATADGGSVAAGHILSFKGDIRTEDLWVLKTGVYGNVQWEYSMGDNESETARSIVETAEGNYVLIGTNKSKGFGKGDIWVVCISNKGSLLWDKTFGSPQPDEGASIIQTKDGNLVIVGTTYVEQTNALNGTKKAQQSVWLAKLDTKGGLLWDKTFANLNYNVAQSVVELPGGDLVVAANTLVKDKSMDGWLIKTNSTGEQQWSKFIGGKKLNSFKNAIATNDGNVVAVGNTFDQSPNGDAWIVKVSSSGDIAWEKTLAGNDYETAESVEQNTSGDLQVIVNVTDPKQQNNLFIINSLQNSNGSENWSKIFADNSIDKITASTRTTDDEVLLTGTAARSLAPCYQSKEQKNAWLIKMRTELDALWAPYNTWEKAQK